MAVRAPPFQVETADPGAATVHPHYRLVASGHRRQPEPAFELLPYDDRGGRLDAASR